MAETKRLTIPAAEELLGKYYPVLDHGFVSLVDYMGGDTAVDEAARASYGPGTRKVSEERGLIRYLNRKEHSSPSEMVELKFHMKLPIFVARQIVRTRTASLNELSARYSLMPLQFYTPKREDLCCQSTVNKQGKSEPVSDSVYHNAVDDWNNLREQASETYTDLLSSDVARELARIDLPMSTYTEWYWKIDLNNLLKFLSTRADSHAQAETQSYARIMGAIVKQLAPLSFEAFLDYNPRMGGALFGRAQMDLLRRVVDYNELAALVVPKEEKREFNELLAILKAPRAIPDFELPSNPKTADFYAQETAKYTPDCDKT